MVMHTSVGRRVRDSWRLIETKETGETCGDQWICTQVKKKVQEAVGD